MQIRQLTITIGYEYGRRFLETRVLTEGGQDRAVRDPFPQEDHFVPVIDHLMERVRLMLKGSMEGSGGR